MPEAEAQGERVVLYARVSTGTQHHGTEAPERQLGALREHAEQAGYEVVGEATDAEEDGAELDRPDLARVQGLVAEGAGVSAVLAADRGRFSRNPLDLYLLENELRGRGCQLLSLREAVADVP